MKKKKEKKKKRKKTRTDERRTKKDSNSPDLKTIVYRFLLKDRTTDHAYLRDNPLSEITGAFYFF